MAAAEATVVATIAAAADGAIHKENAYPRDRRFAYVNLYLLVENIENGDIVLIGIVCVDKITELA